MGSAGAAAAVGLLAAVILHFRFGKAVVEIQVDDPDVQVALRGTSLIVTAPGNDEVKVDPGENELTITHKGLKFKTAAFKLERGSNQAVKVSVAGPNVAVRQGDKEVAVVPVPTAPAENLATGRIGMRTATTTLVSPPHPHLLVSPFDAVAARTARSDWAAYAKVSAAITNTIGMKLVLIPPGEYRMGPYKGHLVRITRPWYSGVYEVTRGQFAQFVAATNYRTLAEDLSGGAVLVDEPTPEKWEPRQQRTWRILAFRRRMTIRWCRSPGPMQRRFAIG